MNHWGDLALGLKNKDRGGFGPWGQENLLNR